MAFAGDLRYHQDLVKEVLESFLRRPSRDPKVDRTGGTTDGKNHFVEFYNERGKPSPTGILRTTDHMWTVVLPTGFLSVNIWSLRQFCYPNFERWVTWGGDHNKAFAGSLVPLTKFPALMKHRCTETEREELHWKTEKLIAAPPPVKPPEQTALFSSEKPSDADNEDDE